MHLSFPQLNLPVFARRPGKFLFGNQFYRCGSVTANETESNLANTASLIWHALKSMPEPSNHINWAGKREKGPVWLWRSCSPLLKHSPVLRTEPLMANNFSCFLNWEIRWKLNWYSRRFLRSRSKNFETVDTGTLYGKGT